MVIIDCSMATRNSANAYHQRQKLKIIVNKAERCIDKIKRLRYKKILDLHEFRDLYEFRSTVSEREK